MHMIFVRKLVWDKANIEHIARHGVTPVEVEEVCVADSFILYGHSGRTMIVGPTKKGRALSIVLDPEIEEGVWYPVTARPADRKERKLYKEEKGVNL